MIRFFFLFFLTPIAFSQNNIPKLTSAIMDMADLIDADSEQKIKTQLENYFDKTGGRFVVTTYNEQYGTPIADVTASLVQQWNLKDVDSALLLIDSKNGRIDVQFNGKWQDAVTKSQVDSNLDRFLVKNFAQKNYARGIEHTTQAFMQNIDEFLKMNATETPVALINDDFLDTVTPLQNLEEINNIQPSYLDRLYAERLTTAEQNTTNPKWQLWGLAIALWGLIIVAGFIAIRRRFKTPELVI